jgi:hypothetical protein
VVRAEPRLLAGGVDVEEDLVAALLVARVTVQTTRICKPFV